MAQPIDHHRSKLAFVTEMHTVLHQKV